MSISNKTEETVIIKEVVKQVRAGVLMPTRKSYGAFKNKSIFTATTY
ncbi:hypothetical protein [Lysinibacillus fusiformis]|nr:hypothetical protein [Lysinibacillus fusiformis]